MAIFWRSWAALVVIILAIVMIFIALAMLQFNKINANLVGERLTVLANRTAAPFESVGRIGLPLSNVRNADALLEEARLTDGAITAIHLFDAKGRIIHSTQSQAPERLTPAELVALHTADKSTWYQEKQDGFLTGVAIAGPAGQNAGGILISYSNAESSIRVWAMGAELALAGIEVLLVGAVLAAFLVRLGLARQITEFEAIEHDIAGFEQDTWRNAAAEGSPGAESDTPGRLRKLLDTAFDRYRAAAGEINAAERQE